MTKGTKAIKVTKLHTEFFVRYALLTEEQKKRFSSSFRVPTLPNNPYGPPVVLPPGFPNHNLSTDLPEEEYNTQWVSPRTRKGQGIPKFSQHPIGSGDVVDKPPYDTPGKSLHRAADDLGDTMDSITNWDKSQEYEGSSVMDDSENDEDGMPETESFEKRMIGRVTQEIDDAIASKGLITDRATQDSLMNYIIQATKLAVKDAAQQGELDGITQEEYDNLIRDIVESSYNSLVHKIGVLDTSLLTDPRRLSFDEYMRNGGGVRNVRSWDEL